MVVVTSLRKRARQCAELAGKLQGDDKTKMEEIAREWLELANAAAKRRPNRGKRPRHPGLRPSH